MSKFNVKLSMKNIKIIKHSLEKRIENDKKEYETIKYLERNHELSDDSKAFIKDHEEHIKCLEKLIDEIECVGYMHGRNIFGSKYN